MTVGPVGAIIATMNASFPVDRVRERFPGLAREVGGQPAVFLDGPAGSQVPQSVIDAVGRCMADINANAGGVFATSVETDQMLSDAGQAMADLLGAGSADEVVFGANMTTLTFMLASAMSKTWSAGDRIILTRLDHDANVSPWELAARDVGAEVFHVGVSPDDGSLDLEQLKGALSDRTRLVAVPAASNLIGTVQPIRDIVQWSHAAGAQVFVDAVHYAPHRLMDVADWGCDFLCCSAYKFFGPHVGVLWARGELLDALPARKLRVAPDYLPERWLLGTQNHEGIAGAAAAVEYLADLGREVTGDRGLQRRAALRAAFEAIERHEGALAARFLEGLGEIPGLRVWGLADPSRVAERAPTIAITHEHHRPADICRRLAEQGVFAWSGNNYALPLTEALGLEPDGVVRLGLLHYNSLAEVERVVEMLRRDLS